MTMLLCMKHCYSKISFFICFCKEHIFVNLQKFCGPSAWITDVSPVCVCVQGVVVLNFPALGVFSAPPGLPSFHSLSSHPGQVSEAHPPLQSPLLNPSSQTGICWALCLPLLPGGDLRPWGLPLAQPPKAHIWPCPLHSLSSPWGALRLQSLREGVGMRGKAALAGYSLFAGLKSQGWILHSPQGGGRGHSGSSPSYQATGRD